jgi:hypothetical protein
MIPVKFFWLAVAAALLELAGIIFLAILYERRYSKQEVGRFTLAAFKAGFNSLYSLLPRPGVTISQSLSEQLFKRLPEMADDYVIRVLGEGSLPGDGGEGN